MLICGDDDEGGGGDVSIVEAVSVWLLFVLSCLLKFENTLFLKLKKNSFYFRILNSISNVPLNPSCPGGDGRSSPPPRVFPP